MNQAAYRALRESAAWIDLNGRGKIRATGEDRVRFLHAMSTNHVQELATGEGCYAFFLSAQGRILADANLFRLADSILIDTAAETAGKLYQHLDRYIIADDVTLSDVTAETATVSVEGPEAASVLKKLDAPIPDRAWGAAEWGTTLVARVSTAGPDGFEFYVPLAEKETLLRSLEAAGAPAADAEAADTVRLENGKPRYGIDFTETNIPQETRLMHAVHFAKGCYIGQEIVERVRSRGHVNKMLVRLAIQTRSVPPAGTKVFSGDKEAGAITSARYSPAAGTVAAFAIIRAEAAAAGNLRVEEAGANLLEQPVERGA